MSRTKAEAVQVLKAAGWTNEEIDRVLFGVTFNHEIPPRQKGVKWEFPTIKPYIHTVDPSKPRPDIRYR